MYRQLKQLQKPDKPNQHFFIPVALLDQDEYAAGKQTDKRILHDHDVAVCNESLIALVLILILLGTYDVKQVDQVDNLRNEE